MKKMFSILYTSYKNYIVYVPDVVWINIILVLRLLVIWILYAYLYDSFWVANKIEWYSIEQVTYAVIIAQIITTAKPKISDEIQQDVKSWKISAYLLNPANYIYFKFLEFFPIFLHNVIFWLIFWITIWFILLGVIPLSLWWILWWIILLIGSMLTSFFGYVMIWLLSFYVEDNEPFRFIYSKMDMILWWNLLPIPFLPWILKTIAFASPFAYFWYTTGLIFTNFELLKFIEYFWIQMIWLIINISICLWLYSHAKTRLTINWG